LDKTHLTPGTKKLVQSFLAGDGTGGSRLKLSADQGSELRQFLHNFLIFHLGRLPRGRAAALADAD